MISKWAKATANPIGCLLLIAMVGALLLGAASRPAQAAEDCASMRKQLTHIKERMAEIMKRVKEIDDKRAEVKRLMAAADAGRASADDLRALYFYTMQQLINPGHDDRVQEIDRHALYDYAKDARLILQTLKLACPDEPPQQQDANSGQPPGPPPLPPIQVGPNTQTGGDPPSQPPSPATTAPPVDAPPSPSQPSSPATTTTTLLLPPVRVGPDAPAVPGTDVLQGSGNLPGALCVMSFASCGNVPGLGGVGTPSRPAPPPLPPVTVSAPPSIPSAPATPSSAGGAFPPGQPFCSYGTQTVHQPFVLNTTADVDKCLNTGGLIVDNGGTPPRESEPKCLAQYFSDCDPKGDVGLRQCCILPRGFSIRVSSYCGPGQVSMHGTPLGQTPTEFQQQCQNQGGRITKLIVHDDVAPPVALLPPRGLPPTRIKIHQPPTLPTPVHVPQTHVNIHQPPTPPTPVHVPPTHVNIYQPRTPVHTRMPVHIGRPVPRISHAPTVHNNGGGRGRRAFAAAIASRYGGRKGHR